MESGEKWYVQLFESKKIVVFNKNFLFFTFLTSAPGALVSMTQKQFNVILSFATEVAAYSSLYISAYMVSACALSCKLDVNPNRP